MKIKEILSKLTFDEKLSLITGADMMTTKAIEKYEIPSKRMADGPNGVRITEEENCTQFPGVCTLASSWSTDSAKKMGEGLANDCIKHGIDMLLAPGINIKRHILCGRNFEYFSEDPVLAGELSAAYINGVEEQGIGTSLKHLAVNSQEKNRTLLNADIDERTMREIYLKGFEIAVNKSKPSSVMCAYNKVNALWCSENRQLLTEILKDEWGYDGLVISDWGAVHDATRAIKAGIDLDMPCDEFLFDTIKRDYDAGKISIEDIDRAVTKVIEFALKPKAEKRDYDRDLQHKLATEVARDGIVLLKNDDNVLPITPEKYKRITVFGEYAVNPLTCGMGSAEVYAKKEYIDNPLEELKKRLPGIEVKYEELYKKGAFPEIAPWLGSSHFHEYTKESDLVILFVGSMLCEDTENFDRQSAYLNEVQTRFIENVVETGKKAVVVLQNGGALILDKWTNDVSAICEMWLGGEGAGGAIADVLCGIVNPSGKLPETFPNKMRTDLEYPGKELVLEYNEKLDVGYRYYDKHPDEIMYPFGHGLSYTNFEYRGIVANVLENEIEISLTVKNVGDYDGSEVVQIYVGDPVSVVKKPIKELKAFKKIFIKKGEEQKISFRLEKSAFAYYNTSLHSWVVENGIYDIYAGASSQDIRLTTSVQIDDYMPYTMQRMHEASRA